MTQKFDVKIIAGGVVRDAEGNVIDDSSERAAQRQLHALGLANLMEGE